MNGISLSTIHSGLFVNGSKGVHECLALLDSMSMFVKPADKPRFDNYINAVKRFLPLCSDFLDVVAKNHDFFVYTLLVDYVRFYPKTKQNLANQKELVSSLVNFYLMKRKKSKLYNQSKDPILKFLQDNSINVYNSIVVATNILRAKDLIKPM
jgi:hypothetical protein